LLSDAGDSVATTAPYGLNDIEYEHILDYVGTGIRIISRDFTVRHINRTFSEMLAVLPQEIIGRKCWQVFPSPLCNTPDCRLLRMLKGERRVITESERPIKDGTFVPCTIIAIALLSPGGEVIGIMEIFRDNTESNRLKEMAKESEERYQALIQLGTKAGEAVVMLQDIGGQEGCQTFVSDQWLRITGYRREELLGTSFFDLVIPSDRTASVSRHRTKMHGQAVPGLFELHIQRKDGLLVPIELTGAFTTFQGRLANVLYIRDISERKQIELALAESERLYHAIFDATGTAMCILDEKGILILANQEWESLSGYSAAESCGKPYSIFITPRDQERIAGYWKTRSHDQLPVPRKYECKIIHKQKSERHVLVSASMIPGTGRLILSSLDISDIKQIENRLKRSEHRLRLLSRRMINTQEEERLRIARDLHDQLSQELAVLRLDSLSLTNIHEDKALAISIEKLGRSIDHLIDAVHRIATDLRPKMLDELGLVGALQWYAEEFEHRTGISCPVNLDPSSIRSLDIRKEIATAAYRIVQESLINALRHAKASQVLIDVALRRESLVVSITDNGIGLDADKMQDKSSLGLLGMRERVSLVGGTLRVRGSPEKGTSVTAYLPVVSHA
jgi:PAS domain S-box-containing protein